MGKHPSALQTLVRVRSINLLLTSFTLIYVLHFAVYVYSPSTIFLSKLFPLGSLITQYSATLWCYFICYA